MADKIEIPSELIEPHLAKFFGSMIECIATDFISPAEAKAMLRGIDWFVSDSCGIHAKLACSNEVDRFKNVDDSALIKMAKKIVDKYYSEP